MGVRWGQAVVFLALWVSLSALPPPAWARVREASDSVVNSATHTLVENLADGGTDLPPFLAHPSDVYLFVTAGAAYTDVRVLADPATDPRRLARALEASEPGTPLAGATVEWSADTYAAAHIAQGRGRLGRLSAANTVPIAALMAGLRRAGFVPHVLLRVPRYARASGPARAHWGTRRFRWYDGHALAGASDVTVSAGISPKALWPLLLPLLLPLLALAVLGLALRLARDERHPLEARRRFFRILVRMPLLGLALAMPLLAVALPSSKINLVADLWLGSATALPLLFPLILLAVLPMSLLTVFGKAREVRLFGRATPGPAMVWLSDEEKALQKRMQQWTLLPHLVGAVLLMVVLFLVPHRSVYYSYVHPLSQLLMVGVAGLVPLLFRKQMAAFTKRTMDDDLTFRARRFGQLLGTRPRDVWVEESSRASHFATAFRDKDHIVVTRKLRTEFTPGETDWVLAHHAARIGQRTLAESRLVLLLLLPMIPVATLLIGLKPSSAVPARVLLSPWFAPILIGIFAVWLVLIMAVSQWSARARARQVREADRRALEVTGDLAVAESALGKLTADTLPTFSPMASPAQAHTLASQVGRTSTQDRQAALRTAAAKMGLVTGPSIRR